MENAEMLFWLISTFRIQLFTGAPATEKRFKNKENIIFLAVFMNV
jgi:hypothetical protein